MQSKRERVFANREAHPAWPKAIRSSLLELSQPELEFPCPTLQTLRVNQAFILGAGLGKRLRPLTDRLPKPLVPLFHRPLAEWAMDACRRVGIERFAINTHHLPEAWEGFGAGGGVTLFHEPVLLETGGGLKNIEPWIGNQPLLIHNGDIFSTMPLEKLLAAHQASSLPVTLALRSRGEAKHIALDATGKRIIDIHKLLGVAPGTHVFSGIYCIDPAFLGLIPGDTKISVIPAFLELAKNNLLGAITLDEGVWLDLGDRNFYLQAHQNLGLAPAIHPDARVDSAAYLENTVVGPGAVIAAGAIVRNSVVWPGCTVAADALLDQCIVFSNSPARGTHQNQDL
jgi:mannose-1-phosphate guanylyltransferase